MGAALAFYTLFSMAPLLLLVIAITGLLVGDDTARQVLSAQLTQLLGEKGAGAVEGILAAAANREQGILAAAVSLGTLILGATSVFGELRTDLDRIWKATPPPTNTVWKFLRARVLSFGLVLTLGFLLLVSLALSAFISVLGKFWTGWFPGAVFMLRGLEFMGSFFVITLLFAMIYKLLPSVRLAWGDVWKGAAVTSLLFWIGKYLIGLYLGKSAVASPFGAAGTLIVVILWVYYSAQIFFFGAEFTKAYAERRGSFATRSRATAAAPAAVPAGGSSAPALRIRWPS